MYREAQRLEKQGKLVEAYLLYAQAAAADPTAKVYWAKAKALRTRAIEAAGVLPKTLSDLKPDVDTPGDDGQAPDVEASDKDIEQAREPQPPPVLDGNQEVHGFELKADSKALWERISKTYGLDVIFDSDFKNTQNIRFYVDNVNYRDALYILQQATDTFVVPISSKLMLVVNDTPQKRAEQETHISIAVPIPDPVTVQEAQEMARSIQQVMEIQRFAIDSASRVVIFRDRQSKARPAAALFQQLTGGKAQVELEIELITVAKQSNLNFGIPLPTSATIYAPTGPFSIPSAVQYLTRFSVFGANAMIGVGVLSTQLIANVNSSRSTTFFKTDMRTEDGSPAQFHVGDKYPIVTATYTLPQGVSNVQLPSSPVFNFEDLGLMLKVTPKVHGTEEVTLDIDAEYKVLGGSSFNGIPVISTRTFKDFARMKFGEWAVIAGLVNDQESRSLGGIAGLASVPFLGPLFSNNTRDINRSQTLLVIKPHLLSLPPSDKELPPIWVGTETRLRVPI